MQSHARINQMMDFSNAPKEEHQGGTNKDTTSYNFVVHHPNYQNQLSNTGIKSAQLAQEIRNNESSSYINYETHLYKTHLNDT